MVSKRVAAQRNHTIVALIALISSVLFFLLIFSGYFLLFRNNLWVAVPLGFTLAGLAVLITKWLGSEEKGIRRHWPVFVVLLIVSAVGVFNSLMLNFEGRYVFLDAIEESQKDYQGLGNEAARRLTEQGILQRQAKINSTLVALISEINNPLNCGQGPVARRLIGELRRELPGFEPLSAAGVDCSRNEEVIADYRAKVSQLLNAASWNNPGLTTVVEGARFAREELGKLYRESSGSLGNKLLVDIKPRLEVLDDRYRNNWQQLTENGGEPAELPSALPLRAVQTLGEPSQVHTLIIERFDRATTWLYILAAIFLDSFMVYVWGLVRQRSSKSPKVSSGGSTGGAW